MAACRALLRTQGLDRAGKGGDQNWHGAGEGRNPGPGEGLGSEPCNGWLVGLRHGSTLPWGFQHLLSLQKGLGRLDPHTQSWPQSPTASWPPSSAGETCLPSHRGSHSASPLGAISPGISCRNSWEVRDKIRTPSSSGTR